MLRRVDDWLRRSAANVSRLFTDDAQAGLDTGRPMALALPFIRITRKGQILPRTAQRRLSSTGGGRVSAIRHGRIAGMAAGLEGALVLSSDYRHPYLCSAW